MTDYNLEKLRNCVSLYFSNSEDYINPLNDIIDETDDEEDRESLSTVIDYINLAILEIQRVVERNDKKNR